MSDLAYVQLVLLTERPGARIGRIAFCDLSDSERTVATALDWIRKSERATQGDDTVLMRLLCEESSEWWCSSLAALTRIGAGGVRRRIELGLGIVGVSCAMDTRTRSEQIGRVSDRRKRILARFMYRAWDSDLHAHLMRYVMQNRFSIPGASSLNVGVETP
jgi:hypothetical protein